MTAISFLDPPGPPAFPDPSGSTEPDGSAAPPSSGVPLRDRLIGVGVVVVLVAILAGTVAWRIGRDDSVVSASGPSAAEPGGGSSSPTTPAPFDEWPAEVLPLVRFVERERGAPFTEPVEIQFLAEDEYDAAIQGETEETTPEDDADLAAWEGQMRALGLLDPATDLQDALDQAYGEGTLAYYNTDDQTIRVLGTDLDVARRVTLVHELTHAWQDQQGFLEGYDDLEDSEAFILQTLVEGDATRIEDLYIDSLSDDEFDDFQSQSMEQSADADLSGIPSFLLAGFYSPYGLGGPLVGIVAEQGGNAAVDEALADPPPSESDLMSVDRFYDDLEPLDVAEPSVPEGAERLDGGDFGALSWHLVLSERIDPRQALEVADGWSGDNSVTYRQDDRVCTAAAYRGLTPAATDLAATRLGEWATAMTDHGATVERLGDDVVVRTCESTGVGEVPGRSETALQYPVVRLEATQEVLLGGASLQDSICFGINVANAITFEEMNAGTAFDSDRMAEIGADASVACFG